MFLAATQMLLRVQAQAPRQLPGAPGLFGVGAVIGAIVQRCSAAGGAFLTIPFLAWCNVPLKRAIGTAAANGFPIALAGTRGLCRARAARPGLPERASATSICRRCGLVVVAEHAGWRRSARGSRTACPSSACAWSSR